MRYIYIYKERTFNKAREGYFEGRYKKRERVRERKLRLQKFAKKVN